MHTDPSVVLCMLSRALRSLLLPTRTLMFFFFLESKSILMLTLFEDAIGYWLLGFTRTIYNIVISVSPPVPR